MKKFLLIILMFSVSCSNQNSEEDGDLLNDKDNDIAETEEIQDDDFYSPACLDDWEKVDVVEDVKELFDFKIIEKTGEAKWKKSDESEFLDFDGDPSQVLGKMKDGSLVLGEMSETEEGYSILTIFNINGSYRRYIIGFNADQDINMGMGEDAQRLGVFNIRVGYGFDEESDEIYISVTIKSKIQSTLDGEYFARPFLIKIDSDGQLSYKTWKYEGNSVCQNIIKKDDKIFLICQHWSFDPEIYLATGRVNAEINVIDGKNVYRKLFQSEYLAIPGASKSNNSDGKIYVNYSHIVDFTEAIIPNEYYIVDDEELCVERPDINYFLSENSFEGNPFTEGDSFNNAAFLKQGENFILGGPRLKWIYGDRSFNNMYTAIYIDRPDKDTLFSFGIEDPFFTVGDEQKMHWNYLTNIYPKNDSGLIFASLVTTFDIEDKGRDWITPEILEQTGWPFLPAIVAVNMDNNEVYAKQFFVDPVRSNNGIVFYFDGDIYILMTFADYDEGDVKNVERVLYRLPEEWLINEDAKAKDTRLWIEEF